MPRRPAALLLSTLLALPAPALSEGSGPNLAVAAAGREPGPVARLVLARDLWDEGLRQGDPLLALAAARLARTAGLRAATGWRTDATPALPAAEDAAQPAGMPRDPASDAALALVLVLAEGNPALADLALDAESEARRGTGPAATVSAAEGRVAAGDADLWEIAFNGQVPAEVAIIGDGAADLDLTVEDAAGIPVCRKAGPGDRALCAFTPAWNGWFRVTVANRGTAAGGYRLMTN